MAQLTATGIKKALYGLFSGLDATDEALLANLMLRIQVSVPLFDAATAGTAMTVTPFWRNHTGGNVRHISTHVVAPIAVAADNTDYVTFSVAKYTAAGGSATTVASGDTRAANMNALVAFAPEALTNVDAAVVIADGGVLTVAVAKAGSGKAITAATSHAYAIVLLEPET